MTRRYLCLWFPQLAIDRLIQEGQLVQGEVAATVRRVSNAAYLDAVTHTAQAAGPRIGMTLAGARAICPMLKSIEANPAADRAFLESLALWADRYTPVVALDAGDAIMLDITGCAHLFGGEESLMDDVQTRLAQRKVSVVCALASTSGAAAALARFSGKRSLRIAPEQKLKTVLAALPVSALSTVSQDIAPDTFEGLSRVGLRSIGDLLPIARASLASRFGLALAAALDRAMGHEPRPITPQTIPKPYRVRLRFPDPIGTPEDIENALHRLLERLCERLQSEARGLRRLDWVLYRADATEQALSIGTAKPANNAQRLYRLFAEKLDQVAPEDGIDSMLLAARVVERVEVTQEMLVTDIHHPDADTKALTTIVDRLSNRLGSDNVFRLTPIDSHLPDRAQGRMNALPDKNDRQIPNNNRQIPWPNTADRPIRLLHQPYAIEPLDRAQGLRAQGLKAQGLAAPTVFRIFGRRVLMRVLQGPERIAPEWWRSDAAWQTGARDYFDAEDESGRRFWIYRDQATNPRASSRWYLQGLY